MGKKDIYKITINNWDKHNGSMKKGHKSILLRTNFLSDAKIRSLSPVTRLLYLSCLLVAGESAQSQIEVSHESLVYQSGVKSGSIQSQLDVLQSLQLVTYTKIDILLDRIEKNRIRKTIIEKEVSAQPCGARTEISTRSSKAQPRGAIIEFSDDDICNKFLSSVTHRAQKSWLNAFPSLDWIKQEIRKAHAWCETNPNKAPKDFGKFMLSWLNRGFEDYRKGIPSRRKTNSEINAEALKDLYERVQNGEA